MSFDHESLITVLGLIVIASPALLACVLGVPSLLGWRLSEEVIGKACQAAIVVGLLAALAILALMLSYGTHYEPIELGNWVVLEQPHPSGAAEPAEGHPDSYHFSVKLVFDRLSVPLAILSFVLCGTIAGFTRRYLHREPGFNRFFVLYALFVLGMVLTSVAGTIETLFAGWELVGLSSALLVAFFQERVEPVRNGLWVWVVYRISDAALLLAAIVMHHLIGQGDFYRLLGKVPWPEGHAFLTPAQALPVGILLIVAAAGKSALVPFSGWLPRAMEGPTPSSAIYYGALSVHLGAFLLLRTGPILETSLWLSVLVVVLGLATALYAYLVGTVQTDIKSALTFASLVQVGLIVAEIGLGWRYVPLIHLLGNACLRTLQFLRAPNLLQDYHALENAIGSRLPRVGQTELPAGPLRRWLYRFALERGYSDLLLWEFIVTPFIRLFRFCDGLERRWTDLLAGLPSRESDAVKPYTGTIEDLP